MKSERDCMAHEVSISHQGPTQEAFVDLCLVIRSESPLFCNVFPNHLLNVQNSCAGLRATLLEP